MTEQTNGTSHLDGRVVAITGAGGGFGSSWPDWRPDDGARVVVADIDADGAARVADAIGEQGGDAEAVTVDVRDLASMQAMVSRAVERFGAVDVLVNNAGIMPLAFFADHAQAYEAWDRCIDINFKGVLNGICAVHDQMIEQGRGHIVNISSIYANAGTAGSGVYSATKAAVAVLSDSLRVESQGKIKVTIVRPTGVLGTGLASGVVEPGGLDRHHRPEHRAVHGAGDGVPERGPRRAAGRRRQHRLLGDHPRRRGPRGRPRDRPTLGRVDRRRHDPRRREDYVL